MKDLGEQKIAVSLIDVGDRLRVVDEDYAKLLSENITQVGCLRQPIEVRALDGRYELIAGGHRLRAARILGWASIPARIYDATDDEAKLFEIDENLVRRELNPLDRAVFLIEREEVYLRLHPEIGHGGDRKSDGYKDQMATISIRSFARDTAAKCGMSDRTVRLALSIARGLPEDIRRRIAGTPMAKRQSELLALVKCEDEERHDVLDLLLGAHGRPVRMDVRSVENALKIVRNQREPALSADETAFQRLLKIWGRTNSKVAQRFLDHLLTQGDLLLLLGPVALQRAIDAPIRRIADEERQRLAAAAPADPAALLTPPASGDQAGVADFVHSLHGAGAEPPAGRAAS